MKQRCYVGTRKGLFWLERRENGWEVEGSALLGVAVPMVLPDARTGAVFAVAEHGHFGIKLHRSEDGGASWPEISTPTYPEKPEDVPDILCPMRQTPIPWSLEKIWSLEAGGPDRAGRLWCGTIPGGLFVSSDNGDSWELVRSLWDRPERAKWFGGGYDYPGIHSIWVDPRNSDAVTVSLSIGGVWKSADAGASWVCRSDGMTADYLPPEQAGDPSVQDPHRVVTCRANPDVSWCQHHNGIFKTTNNCDRWERVRGVEPSDFGFAVAVHPENPDQAWFVPAVKDEMRIPVDGALAVTRTDDGGQSFRAFRGGLPQKHAYDLVYRHGLEIDNPGKTLAMGSTTGHLWLSENLGEDWDLATQHLPPIYCVRFS